MDNQTKLDMLKELSSIYENGTCLDLTAVSLEIAPKDPIFTQERHYFEVGFSALQCIQQALFASRKDKDEIKTILDFPSGHGRVLRFIKAYFPQSQITACEIDADALKFCSEQFKVNTLISHEDFQKIEIQEKYDLIWCGSLITHLSKERSKQLLEFFYKVLNENGILIFTSHGRHSRILVETKKQTYGLSELQIIELLGQYEATGYGYVNYNRSTDYGLSIIKPSWLIELLESSYGFKITLYNEKSWGNHQDVIACVKENLLNTEQVVPDRGQELEFNNLPSHNSAVTNLESEAKGIVQHLSGEEIAQQIPIKKLIKAAGFKIAAKPGLRWLYRYRSLGKKMLGG